MSQHKHIGPNSATVQVGGVQLGGADGRIIHTLDHDSQGPYSLLLPSSAILLYLYQVADNRR